MPVVTLTSDYGLTDHRVAAIKGSILSQKLDSIIVDITHNIQAYNLVQAAYIIRNAYVYFPKKSVHIIAVDSFYRKEVRSLLYDVDGHFFIAPDNGILSLIFFDIKPKAIYEITLNNRFDDEVNFTATDIFVPAAVHLIKGGVADVIGRKINNPKEISFPRAIFNEPEKMIVGEIMYIDNFGNLVTNISKKFFDKILAGYKDYTIKFRNLKHKKIFNHYTDFITDWNQEKDYHGKSLVIFNDAGLLEISIYKGNINIGAKTLFGLNVGEKIFIEFE